MRKRRLQRGAIALSSSVLFFMVAAVVTSTAVTSAENANQLAAKATNKAQADVLAESGVAALYDQIWRQMYVYATYPTTVASTSLSSSFGGVSEASGSYSAVVTKVTTAQSTLSNGCTQVNYTFLLTGTGVAKDGTTSTVSATFTGTLVQQPSSVTTTFGFQDAAIQSNTAISIITNGGFQTFSSNNLGHVYATQGISWSQPGGTKNTVNPNVLTLQGEWEVADSPTMTYLTMTKSSSGLGNPNGTTNYQNPSNSSLGASSNSVTGVAPRVFPTATQVGSLQQTWLNAAQSSSTSTTYSSSVSSASVPTVNGIGKTLKAPCFIKGNLNIKNGDQVSFLPTDSNPANNVIYVTGNLQNLGLIENLGCTVVVLGDYTDGPGALYNVGTQGSPYTQTVAINNSALISTSTDPGAISISTNSTSNYGLVYAALGGIQITGSLQVTGALISGTTTVPTGVNIVPPNGNSFKVTYDPNAVTNKPMFTTTTTGTGTTISTPFAPTALNNWGYH